MTIITLISALAACRQFEAYQDEVARTEEATTTYPKDYKSEILTLMRTYLNDPTGIRDAGISQPVIKSVDSISRYIVCLRYNARKTDGRYAGNKDLLVTFLRGRLDRILDGTHDLRESRIAREQCKDVPLAPFPELEKLSR